MNRPPAGLCLPCRFRRLRDADTVEVSIPGSDRQWAIRLLDCWAPEKCTPEGKAALEFVREVLDEADDDLHIWVPAPRDAHRILAGLLTFDRILGHIWLDSQTTLSEVITRAGHATTTKQSAGTGHGAADSETGAAHDQP